MMKRATWLATGAMIGVGGTLWARRRLVVLAGRMRAGEIAGDVVAVADRRAHNAARRLRNAVDEGRVEARRREDQLWSELEARVRAR